MTSKPNIVNSNHFFHILQEEEVQKMLSDERRKFEEELKKEMEKLEQKHQV